MQRTIKPEPIRKTVVVNAGLVKAFEVFAHRMHDWSPTQHSLTGARTGIVIEPRVGGRWYEIGDGGEEADWGRVLEWEPPRRMLLAWQLDAQFAYDPNLITEIEVRFESVGEGRTRVEFEHRNLERFGPGAVELLTSLDSGWGGILNGFAGLLEAEEATGEDA